MQVQNSCVNITMVNAGFKNGVWHLQTADCRSQIADCKLNDTKNVPNKGDVIKNITSCESEKVAYIGLIPKMLLAIVLRLFLNSPGISLIALILYSSLIIVNW